MTERRDHYSYTVYADPEVARSFDARRFGGPIGELVASQQADMLAAFLGDVRHQSILDVGTGTGRAAFLLARAGAVVTGIDASTEMLAIAQARAAEQSLPVTFLTGDAHALAFPDQSFDAAVCLRVLMHSPRWRLCIDELCRVASRMVVLDYPSIRGAAVIQGVARGLARRALGRGGPKEPYRVFFDRQIRSALEANGFRIRALQRQFVIPIAIHKSIGSQTFTLESERWLRRLGLLRMFGSPVTLIAERCASS